MQINTMLNTVHTSQATWKWSIQMAKSIYKFYDKNKRTLSRPNNSTNNFLATPPKDQNSS